jgi:hypothetical protein
MEYLATVADQGLRVGEEDKPGFLTVPPIDPPDEINDDVEAVDAPEPAVDLIVDLVHGIEGLTKHDARARLLELEEDQEETFFEIGGVLSC